MDARGNIYRAPEDEIPDEDKERFDAAVLRGEAERAAQALATAEPYATVKFSRQLIELSGMLDDWSVPVQCKLEAQPDGSYEMWNRYPGGEQIPDEAVRAACEELYGLGAADSPKFMNGTRTALETALDTWRRTVQSS